MSHGVNQRIKVSRQGMVLIKSFEGLRSRAEALDDGRWVIGYGHTLSAREGAMIGEADAELLLHYDLIPVVAAIESAAQISLNQHQIDALASYALSIGAERLADSDVMRLVNAGEMASAAAVLSRAFEIAPDHAPADPVVRRRAAEGALFVQDPASPVALAALLTAPTAEAAQAPEAVAEASNGRAHAVAVLLGERGVDEAAETPPAALADQPPVIAANDAEPDVAEGAPAEAAPMAAVPMSASMEENAAALAAAASFQRMSPYAGVVTGGLPPFPAPMIELDDEGVALAPASDSAPTITPTTEIAADRLLVLTPPPEIAVAPPVREVWSEDQRHPTVEDGAAAELFGDDMALEDPALSIVRHEADQAPTRFDWSETGAFLGMGGVGVVAVGASIAGFRLAADQVAARAFNETTLVSWVLALIGALCVGVAAFNLYQRWSSRRA